MKLRIVLDFEAEKSPDSLDQLRSYLAVLAEQSSLGTPIGPQDLVWAGFVGVRLIRADLQEIVSPPANP